MILICSVLLFKRRVDFAVAISSMTGSEKDHIKNSEPNVRIIEHEYQKTKVGVLQQIRTSSDQIQARGDSDQSDGASVTALESEWEESAGAGFEEAPSPSAEREDASLSLMDFIMRLLTSFE